MSREELEWLNVMTLVGDTGLSVGDRAYEAWTNHANQAWHYREAMQGAEPNHYEGAIPVEDIRRRLFNWEPFAVSPMVAEVPVLTADGVDSYKIVDPDRQMICRPRGAFSDDDPGAILGVFKSGYKIHGYDEWLIRNVQSILDDDLHVSSAGVLKNGAQAWVAVTIDRVTTPEGVEFYPILLSSTSLDGTIGTGYDLTTQLPICDNTLSIGRRTSGRKTRHKHTTNSLAKLSQVREELKIEFARDALDAASAEFSAHVAELTNTTVTDAQWAAFQDELKLTTLIDEKGNPKEKASKTHAMNRRAELEQLYRYDDRCKTWTGTAFGVLQAVNTHAHHVGIVRNTSRPMRNADRAITGGVDKLDGETLAALDKVLAAA